MAPVHWVTPQCAAQAEKQLRGQVFDMGFGSACSPTKRGCPGRLVKGYQKPPRGDNLHPGMLSFHQFFNLDK